MPDTRILDAPITAVTVFRDGARVQRSGTVSMTQGTQAVVIGGLPASVAPMRRSWAVAPPSANSCRLAATKYRCTG